MAFHQPAQDDGVVYDSNMAFHQPAQDDGVVYESNIAFHQPAQDDGVVYESNMSSHQPAQDDGVAYESNMAFHQLDQDDVRCGGEVTPIPDRPLPPISDIKFVFFDTETNGYGQIIQIAAKVEGKEGKTFSAYAYPKDGISMLATHINHLSLDEAGELCYNGQPVEYTSLVNCLRRFLEFLKSVEGPVVLVAHNAAFDLRHAIDAFADYYLLSEFADIVVGASDTVPIMKENPVILFFLEEAVTNGLDVDGILAGTRKGKPQQATQVAGKVTKRTVQKKGDPTPKLIPVVSLEVLAAQYIPNFKAGDAHEALYDCIVLEDLCSALDIDRQTLAAAIKSLSVFVGRRVELLNRKKYAPGLAGMIIPKVISAQTVNKLAERALTMEKLAEKCRADGEAAFASFLKREIINKAAAVNAIIGMVKKV